MEEGCKFGGVMFAGFSAPKCVEQGTDVAVCKCVTVDQPTDMCFRVGGGDVPCIGWRDLPKFGSWGVEDFGHNFGQHVYRMQEN